MSGCVTNTRMPDNPAPSQGSSRANFSRLDRSQYCPRRLHEYVSGGDMGVLKKSAIQESCLTSTIFAGWRQLLLPVHLLILSSLLGRSGPVAGDVEFQDDRVVDHTVDGRSGGHGVGEDVLPLGEDQVGRDA